MGRPAAPFSEPLAAGPVEQFFQWSLLGLLSSGFFALAGSGYLDLPTTILTATGLILRAILVAGGQRLDVAPRWIAALTVAYIGFYPIDYTFLSREFIPATVHMICFLAVLRVLTARTNRDYFFVKVIAFLELLGATLLSASLNFFIFLSMFLVFGVATFCCAEVRRSAQPNCRVVGTPRVFHRRLMGVTASVTAGIVVMTAGLFFLIPRTARAAFRSLVSERYHMAGFSNEVTLGQIGEMQQRTTPMMHVRIEGSEERSGFKWRGAALSHFDGKRWYNGYSLASRIRVQEGWASLASDEQRRRSGSRIKYQVKIDSVGLNALFFTGVPEFVSTNLALLYRTPGETYRTGSGTSDGLHYYGYSYLPSEKPEPEFRPEPLPARARTDYVLLPPIDARIFTLARDVGQGTTAEEKARGVERFLRTNYSYSTELLKQNVPDPLANFLFDRRKGHCEYFASAMAVMLRSLGIPSRVVTGFQSGVYNPITGWHVLRASDAHSWVEAWIPGRGWTVFDPTPPDQRGQTPAIFLSQLALYLDAADMFWQQWVMQYGLEQQLELANRLQKPGKFLSAANWFEDAGERSSKVFKGIVDILKQDGIALGIALTFGIAAWFFGPRLWRWWQTRRHVIRIQQGRVGASDAAVLYRRMLEILRKRGVHKPAWLTPTEFARVVPPSPFAPLVGEITSAYYELRYGDRPEAAAHILQLLRKMEGAH